MFSSRKASSLDSSFPVQYYDTDVPISGLMKYRKEWWIKRRNHLKAPTRVVPEPPSSSKCEHLIGPNIQRQNK